MTPYKRVLTTFRRYPRSTINTHRQIDPDPPIRSQADRSGYNMHMPLSSRSTLSFQTRVHGHQDTSRRAGLESQCAAHSRPGHPMCCNHTVKKSKRMSSSYRNAGRGKRFPRCYYRYFFPSSLVCTPHAMLLDVSAHMFAASVDGLGTYNTPR